MTGWDDGCNSSEGLAKALCDEECDDVELYESEIGEAWWACWGECEVGNSAEAGDVADDWCKPLSLRIQTDGEYDDRELEEDSDEENNSK